jgi:glycosyltransferase involved in cell wall biosynthesis
MHIVHLLKHCEHSHGNVHVAVDLACAQARRGHQVVFASAGGFYEPLLRACGVDHLRIVQNQKRPVTFLRAIWEVARVSRRRRMDLLHAHMMSGALVGYVASRIAGIPLVTTVHNSFDRHSALMRLGDRVVAVSAAERDLLVGRGYKPARVDVVLNGPNGSARDDSASAGYSPELQRPCVTTVCGLHRRKGVFDLIPAFAAASRDLPQWRLYIAGEGPDRAALEAFARDSGLQDRVIFLGSVPSARPVLERSDIFVLASYADPCSLAVAEARAAGCAIIATGVGGTPELLEFGRAGKLVGPGDPERLAAELRQLMTDEAERSAFRLAARRGAEFFRIERVVDDYDAVYQRACNSRTVQTRD